MHKSRRVLSVFLASPSDVAPERKIAGEVVAWINKAVGRQLGWSIELNLWENAGPAFGRPQEILNPMVDDCELFIGLLWKRWGTTTGVYSSGFEEEFEHARSRRKGHGKPDIWLFFKDVEQLEDAGPQLRKVQEFRQAQEERREVLFNDVRDQEEWKTKLTTCFVDYIFKLAGPAIQPQSNASASLLESAAAAEPEPSPSDIPQQLKAIPALLGRVILDGNLEFHPSDAKLFKEFDVARLFLLSFTWMSSRYTSNRLGTHEINLLYKHRERLQATNFERSQLLRAIVGDSGNVVPGWHWFREVFSEQGLTYLLFTLANRDFSEDVRANAVDLLTKAKIKLSADLSPSLLLDDDSAAVRTAIYEYLASIGDQHALTLLNNLLLDGKGRDDFAVKLARFKILARLDPARAFSEVITGGEYVSDDEMLILRECVSQADDELLLKGLKNTWDNIRKVSLIELTRRRRLPERLAIPLIADPCVGIRALAFEALAKEGARVDFKQVREALSEEFSSGFPTGQPVFPSADSIIVTSYCTSNTDKLFEAVDWYSIDGPLAYRALALDRYAEISVLLRADLQDGFRRIKAESSARRESTYGPELRKQHAADFDKYDESTRSSFTESALIGLAANGQAGDGPLARPYLAHDNTGVRDAAVAVISRFGDSEDVQTLLEISAEAWGEVKHTAAAAALRLSSEQIKVACELMKSSTSEVQAVAFNWLLAQDSTEVSDMFKVLLHDDDDMSRMRAVYYCSCWMTREEMGNLLEKYIAYETFYYNVVTWLDRLLYAPSKLRDMFARDLRRRVT